MDGFFDSMQMEADMLQQQNMLLQQQNMMMQQSMMGYNGQNMGVMYNQPIGSVDRYGFVKYTRQQYLDILRNYVLSNCGFQIAISKEQPIEDTPEMLRHCCMECKTKISVLPKLICYVPETNMQITFYFCRDCGKLFYYKDFMG